MTNAKKSHEKANQIKSDTIINKLSKASREIGLLSPERDNEVQDCQIIYLTSVSALSTIEQNNVVMSNKITNNKSNDQ